MPASIKLQKTAVIAKCPLTDNILRIKFIQRESDLEKDAEREGKGDGHKNPAESEQKPAEHTDACVGVLSIICGIVSIILTPSWVYVTLSVRVFDLCQI